MSNPQQQAPLRAKNPVVPPARPMFLFRGQGTALAPEFEPLWSECEGMQSMLCGTTLLAQLPGGNADEVSLAGLACQQTNLIAKFGQTQWHK